MTNIFSATMEQKKYLLPFAALISFIVIFHRLSETPLGSDECFFSEFAKEMEKTGDYLTPQYGYKPDFHNGKPPVFYWLNAIGGKAVGFNAFAMRLPSASLGFLCVLAAMIFANRYFNRTTAFLAGIILTFTQQYLFHARSALTDITFTAFFTFAV
ncbi:MAG: phospholipid carrier-dependent glycosyltransferase, partial [Endomicrobiia bacterium]|nr:phospholipid carrier-dependent glycosyltransferase [Endomicrobiia bacterium]